MTRYIAFLRAINVGGHVVKMEALRRLFESAGAANVSTFIASGNVIFDTSRRSAAAFERTIEACLEKGLGFRVTTFLRTLPEVSAIAAYDPFESIALDPGASRYVAFLKDAPGPEERRATAAMSNAVDEFVVRDREVYWLRRNNLMESIGMTGRVEKSARREMTWRNVTTVRRIAAKYARLPSGSET
jgi:uncharacterized protein (DUF1697 family)